jgi:hypothetical protein
LAQLIVALSACNHSVVSANRTGKDLADVPVVRGWCGKDLLCGNPKVIPREEAGIEPPD